MSDTGDAATLRYAIYGTGSDACHMMPVTNVFTPPRLYLWKSAILECIKIPQLRLVNGVAIDFTLRCNRCDAVKICVVFRCLLIGMAVIRSRANEWFTLTRKFTFKGTSPAN